jgi:hypothetical protein
MSTFSSPAQFWRTITVFHHPSVGDFKLQPSYPRGSGP